MAYHTIKLKKYIDIVEELIAAAIITPGMLLEITSSETVQAHSAAGQNCLPIMFALEDELRGRGVDDQYAAADPVQVWIPQRGEWVWGILADGENVSKGDALESNGAGYLQKYVADVESFESADPGSITVYPNQVVAIAREAVDLSDSSGAEESSGVIGYNKRIAITIC